MSRPTVSKAKTSYPIFAATWGRGGYLVVGGGGGAGNHGIPNAITLFDFSSRAPNVQSAVEIEVSKDDSVACLANLATLDGLILYAGNNSSEEDRLRARNEHFRSFEVQLPKNKRASGGAEKADATISFLSKSRLFSAPQSAIAAKEAYQRLVRLSPPQRTASNTPTKRIGAVASSLAGDGSNEIVIFSATTTKPQDQDIIERIILPKGQETNDLDILDLGEGRFQVAYVVDHEVYIQDVTYDFGQRKSNGNNERRKVYTVPQPDLAGKKARSKLRCIRWLSPKHLLLLANKPNRTGVELLVLHNYEQGPSGIIQRKTLPKHVKAATDMDVALLDADANGAYQIAVAVGSLDISLILYTVDYHGHAQDSLSKFHSFNSYDNVHDVQMTKVVFSPFKPDELSRKAPQYLRLASTSLGNTISVETFQLQSQGSRYVLQTARSRNLFTAATYLVIAMVVAVVALLIQSLIDPEGNLTKGILPSSLQNAASQQKTFGETLREKRHNAILNNADSPVVKTSHRIADLLHLHLPHVLSSSPDSQPSSSDKQQKALIIRDDPETDGTLSTEVLDSHEAVLEQHTQAKKWDDLSKEERKLWKKKLQDAGVWAVEEGETVLKSIFFGQIGGLVGQVAQGVIG
ncbi:Nn.00g088820.m01.CDS01 [Neocucurbitaria sp. VM-36]